MMPRDVKRLHADVRFAMLQLERSGRIEASKGGVEGLATIEDLAMLMEIMEARELVDSTEVSTKRPASGRSVQRQRTRWHKMSRTTAGQEGKQDCAAGRKRNAGLQIVVSSTPSLCINTGVASCRTLASSSG